MNAHYLDHAASTPLRPGVWDAMEPVAASAYGNASSGHRWGRQARKALEDARARVAAVLRVEAREVLFTRGGTEADNLAVQGCARARSGGPTVISAIEHPAIRETARATGPCVEVPCRASEGIDLDALWAALDNDPTLVSVMWVNNETGDVLPVPAIAERCAERRVPCHSDAVQAVGKIDVRLDQVPLSMMTLTGHKFGGPKGTGALFVRSGSPVEALYFGGGQERGLRPGTSDVAGAVGFALALELAVRHLDDEARRLTQLRDRLERSLVERFPDGAVHTLGAERAPHIVNFGIPGQDRSVLLAALDLAGIAASGGSACSSGASGPSPIVAAMYGHDHPLTAVRLSLGWSTTENDIDAAVAALDSVVTPQPSPA